MCFKSIWKNIAKTLKIVDKSNYMAVKPKL